MTNPGLLLVTLYYAGQIGASVGQDPPCCDLPVCLFCTLNALSCLYLLIIAFLSSIRQVEATVCARLSFLPLVIVEFFIVQCKRPVLLSCPAPALNLPWNWRLTLTPFDFTTFIFTFASTGSLSSSSSSIINSSSFPLLILFRLFICCILLYFFSLPCPYSSCKTSRLFCQLLFLIQRRSTRQIYKLFLGLVVYNTNHLTLIFDQNCFTISSYFQSSECLRFFLPCGFVLQTVFKKDIAVASSRVSRHVSTIQHCHSGGIQDRAV